MITRPTREKSIIDHIYTNRVSNISASGVLELDISDHFGIYLNRKLRSGEKRRPGAHTLINYRNWKSIDYNLIESKISKIELKSNDCLNKICNDFNEKINNIMNEEIKLKTKRIKVNTIDNWINSDILEMMAKRDKLFRIWKKSEHSRAPVGVIEINHQIYKDIRNKTRYEIRKAKVNYSYNRVNEYSNESKNLWKFINRCIPHKNKSKERLIPLTATQLNDSFIDQRF